MILRTVSFRRIQIRRSSKDNEGGGGGILVIAAIAIAAIIVGFIGVFFGNLIKLQFRDNVSSSPMLPPCSRSGNLWSPSKNRRLLQWLTPGELQCFEASHMFFSQPLQQGLNGLQATHPPLEMRIRAIDPHWDGKFSPVSKATGQGRASVSTAAGVTSGCRSTATPSPQAS